MKRVGIGEDGLVRPAGEQPPEVALSPQQWADWLASDLPAGEVLTHVPAWASRNVGTALHSARSLLEHDPVPPPPALPEP